jgi:hypothetical protein
VSDATAGDGLGELAHLISLGSKLPWRPVGGTHDREIIDSHGCHVATTGILPDAALIVAAVNALPALRDVLAAAARDAEAVTRVRELHAIDATEPHACSECGEAWPCCTTEALNGTP